MITTKPLKKYSLEIAVIFLLFIDLFTKVLPILPLSIIIIAIQFFRLNINANIFLSLIYLPLFFGGIMNSYGISGIGGYFIILGILLFSYGYITKKTRLYNYKKGSLVLILLLLMFFFSSQYAPGDWAMEKWSRTARTGIVSFIGFVVLFSNIEKIDRNILGMYFLLYSFFLLRVSILANQINGPQSIFDFGFLRYQSTEALSFKTNDFSVSYHTIGYYALIGLSIMLMSQFNKRNGKLLVVYLFFTFLAIVYSGARQTIVIFFLLALVWSFKYFKSKLKKLLMILLVLLVVILFYNYNPIIQELFSSTVSEGLVEGAGRGPWLIRGIELFKENVFFGVGFGGYSIFGVYATYPHNIIVELLSETGLFGLFFSILLVLPFLFMKKDYKYNYIYLLLIYVLSSIVSYGINTNIIIFSLIFALPALSYKTSLNFINK